MERIYKAKIKLFIKTKKLSTPLIKRIKKNNQRHKHVILGMEKGISYRNSKALGTFEYSVEQKLMITDHYVFGHHGHSFLLTANRRHIYLHMLSSGWFPCNDGFRCHRMYVYSNLLSLGALTMTAKNK